MRAQADIDPPETLYFYLHTKGLRHFGTKSEQNVIDWINLMLYWNIEQWVLAVIYLKDYDTYGCGYKKHYSGNFWWATVSHIKRLPKTIPRYYTAPEDWVCKIKNKIYCIFRTGLEGGGHYNKPYPRENYINKCIL